jgi:hypothetical protein
MYVEALVYGNYSTDEALHLSEHLRTALASTCAQTEQEREMSSALGEPKAVSPTFHRILQTAHAFVNTYLFL